MKNQAYPYVISSDYLEFGFESVGPKGRIRKIIRLSPENSEGITYFNLSFGDLEPDSGNIEDLTRSNNLDRDIILATIAATVVEFTRHFPDTLVYARGSTASRTRLYQMGIASHWDEIRTILNVYGYSADRGWEPFRKNIPFEAFLAKHK